MASNQKKCPYCGEEIALSARKCRFCGEWLDSLESSDAKLATISSNTPAENTGKNPAQINYTENGQPIVVNVNNQQSVEQAQTVIVAGGSSEGAPGWIFTEMWVIAAGIGIALKSWWWFLGIGVGGSALLMVPYIGAAMCVVIGLGWGIIAAAIGAALFSTSAAWVLGILFGAGAIFGHLEARKANLEENT